MGKREIRKTVVKYDEKVENNQNEQRGQRERSRQKQLPKANREETVKVQEVNVNSRRARLQAMRRAREQEEVQQPSVPPQVLVKIQEPIIQSVFIEEKVAEQKPKQIKRQPIAPKRQDPADQQNESQQEEEQRTGIIRKPVFIAKQYREDKAAQQEQLKQQQRRKKNVKYTTKMLLEQQKYEDSEEQNQNSDSQNDIKANAINDDDTVDEQLQFQLWKIRELNRIRRDRQERRKHELEKAEINRRRQMTNQAVLLQNRELGSDATDNNTETKYVFMQKYYHRGAFYQDSEDEVFKRDYNLPTPMQMQDKSLLPQILQKRIGNFGKKGQSKYTHLTAEDTTELNPLARPDESILQFWKRRTAGYKGSYNKNV